MPLHPPWKQVYTPRDLVFGLSANVDSWLDLHNPDNQPLAYPAFVGELAGTADGYAHIEETSAYGPEGLAYARSFLDTLLEHPKYQSCGSWDDDGDEDSDEEDAALRRLLELAYFKRKSKGALFWIINRHPGVTIHFVLDDLDGNTVATKSGHYARQNDDGSVDQMIDFPQGKAPPHLAVHEKMRLITNSELRWLYRNREDPRVQSQVQFWSSINLGSVRLWNPCGPPWRDLPGADPNYEGLQDERLRSQFGGV